jgi:16S rRNA (guanine527-N7)-methyltransferase
MAENSIKSRQIDLQSWIQHAASLLEQNKINFLPFQIELIGNLYNLSLHWGDKINITKNLSLERFFTENILDPLCAIQRYSVHFKNHVDSSMSLIDLGCGGGYVGLLWHIFLQEEICTTLMDGDRRKINFCKQAIRELGLKNIQAIHARAEDYQISAGKGYDLCVSRATWDFSGFLSQGRRFLSSKGHLISFESSSFLELEVNSAITTLQYSIQPIKIERKLAVFIKKY